VATLITASSFICLLFAFSAEVTAQGFAHADGSTAVQAVDTPIQWRRGKLRLIPGLFNEGGGTHFAHLDGGVETEFNEAWRGELAARIDYWRDTSTEAGGEHKADIDALFLQWRGGERHRATLGYQIVRWGKTDEISPTDRVVREDWSRPFEDLADRRRALPMLRYEHFGKDFNLDLLWRPWFKEAEMPRLDSSWSPIDQKRGRLLGFAPDPAMAFLVSNGRFIDEPEGGAGWGARLSANERGYDWALSAQRWRRSAPYYAIDLPSLTFQGRHPTSLVLGGEFAAALGPLTTRAEFAFIADEPVTMNNATLNYTTIPAYEAVAGLDWWPGDKDTLVVMQLAWRQLDKGGLDILDHSHSLALTGSVRTEWGHGNWQARLRYSIGLDRWDNYFNPSLTWTGWEAQQLSLGGHWFSGRDSSPGGYYKDKDFIYLEWRHDL
jgi:hypothetical protein